MPIQKDDFRYKWAIRDALLTALYAPVQAERDALLLDLIKCNCVLLSQDDLAKHGAVQLGHQHPSFAYNGKFYTFEPSEGPPVRNRVHPTLMPEVAEVIKRFDFDILLHEKTLVTGYLTSMLSYSHAPADYLPVLPSALHGTLQQTVSCDWTRVTKTEEGVTAFLSKYQKGYDLMRQRMAFNLIS